MKITKLQSICGFLSVLHAILSSIIIPFAMAFITIKTDKSLVGFSLMGVYLLGIFLPAALTIHFEKNNKKLAKFAAYSPLAFIGFFASLFIIFLWGSHAET